jgi:ABC-type antimicrobial peptide transport system permease subunit
MEKTMSNNTTNETSNNDTALDTNQTANDTNATSNVTANDVSESGMLDGLMDALQDSPELMLMVVVMAAMAAYIAYTVPAVRMMVMPYLKKYDEEILELLDKNLTAAQVKAYEKLDEAAQKHVKDAMLRNVIMSVYDQNDDKFVAVVKTEAKDALAEAKKL